MLINDAPALLQTSAAALRSTEERTINRDSFFILTCMFVRRLCFLALLTASLLQEESSALHHEEALAQTAKTKRERNAVNQTP